MRAAHCPVPLTKIAHPAHPAHMCDQILLAGRSAGKSPNLGGTLIIPDGYATPKGALNCSLWDIAARRSRTTYVRRTSSNDDAGRRTSLYVADASHVVRTTTYVRRRSSYDSSHVRRTSSSHRTSYDDVRTSRVVMRRSSDDRLNISFFH